MARCGCASGSCGCKVNAGSGITVTGTGTAADPYVIVNAAASLASSFGVNDTSTLDLTLAGSGTNLDPFILSGVVTVKLQQLSDVSNPGGNPLQGQFPQYVGVSGSGGHWEFGSVAPAYTTGARPAVAGQPIGFMYFDTTINKPVWKKNSTTYVDATGATV